jgi:tRNA ligase
MNLDDSLEQAVRRAVNGLVKLMNLPSPSDEAIKEAISSSEKYKLSEDKRRQIKPAGSSETKARKSPPRYFALVPENFGQQGVISVIDDIVFKLPSEDNNLAKFERFWSNVKANKRVVENPHVTLVHKMGVETNEVSGLQEFWDACLAAAKTSRFEFILSHLVYNQEIAALVLDDGSITPLDVSNNTGPEFLTLVPEAVMERLHITVGTRDSGVKPIQARDLVLRWRKGKLGSEEGVIEISANGNIKLRGRLEGLWA